MRMSKGVSVVGNKYTVYTPVKDYIDFKELSYANGRLFNPRWIKFHSFSPHIIQFSS